MTYTFRRYTCGLVLSVFASSALLASMPTLAAEEQTHEIRVSAQSSIKVAPDIATLQASLEERTSAVPQNQGKSTDPKALADARGRLEKRFTELYRKIEAAGVAEKDIQAGSLSVQQEQFDQKNSGDKNNTTMVRTHLERPLTLTIRNLDKVPALMDALTAAGVDQLSGVNYGLANEEAAQDKALKKALERAKVKAQLMADTLGVHLGKLVSVNESGGNAPRPMMMARMAVASAPAQAKYNEGDIDLNSSVSVVWSISQ